MKYRNTARKLALIISLLGLATLPASSMAQDRHGPLKPTNTQLLAEFGFDATPESLALAIASPDPFARLYGLKVIAENGNAAFLPQANELLADDFIKVRLEAAILLAKFNVAEGVAWLENWETQVTNCADVQADTAHVVLDAASTLASRGDERLAHQVRTCLRHESWAVKMHAARALADFHDLSKPELESAWLESVDVAIETAKSSAPPPPEYVNLYLQWLNLSASKQSQSVPAIANKFAELGQLDDAATHDVRAKLDQAWNAGASQSGTDESGQLE